MGCVTAQMCAVAGCDSGRGRGDGEMTGERARTDGRGREMAEGKVVISGGRKNGMAARKGRSANTCRHCHAKGSC